MIVSMRIHRAGGIMLGREIIVSTAESILLLGEILR